ncbi:hypothetical protein ETR14_27760 (plasmid) [Sphingosinicella sp. BN140058]|nr:hypothetical protein ETR14_27760 [Sphingosinicella sp. BN140058]
MTLDGLGDDAILIAGSTFALATKLHLGLRESKPSDRLQAALDELVAKDILSVEPFNDFGGLVYRTQASTRLAQQWVQTALLDADSLNYGRLQDGGDLHFALYVPIGLEEAETLMTPYGRGVFAGEKGKPRSSNPYPADTEATAHKDYNRGWRLGRRSYQPSAAAA